MTKHKVKRYSEAFKQQVVREYEAGTALYILRKKYGIGGMQTVQRWVKQYSLAGLRHEVIRIQTMDEANRVKELEKRIRDMEGVISQLLLDKLMLETTLEVVEEDYGIEVKKNAARSLSERRQK